MKVYVASICLALLSIVTLLGCKKINGKGAVSTQSVQLSSFDGIDLSSQGDVTVVYDNNRFVEVTSHENILEALKIEVKDNRLKLGVKQGYSIGNYEQLTYSVHTPFLSSVNISGAGSITTPVSGTNFDAKIAGSGTISAYGLNTSYAKADISGSGSITLNGSTNNAELNISGSGNIKNFGLTSSNTNAKISGSGDIETTTNSTLSVTISGSGDVKYKGNPTITSNISGAGNVVNAN